MKIATDTKTKFQKCTK